ncbi:MAG: hypothetical protein PHI42_08455 [Paludibacteraceae bacterium]|nr:hypothetical protein [Paludibacteraceae bacterium]
MKKLLVLVALIAMSAVAVNAQKRAIGARLGNGLEFSYQHNMGEKNMLEIDAGLPAFVGIEAAATYDWIFPISSWKEAGSWNWYAGVGAGAGWYWWGWAYAGIAGRLGIEYNFDFPLNLSLDWRPLIGPEFGAGHIGFNSYGLYQGGIALGVRYRF